MRPLFREMSAFTHETAADLQGPEWLRGRRAAALERFDDAGLPTEAEEIWRYSRISELDLDRYSPVQTEPETGVPGAAVDSIEAVGARAGLLVTRNGVVAHTDLDPAVAKRGVEIGDVLAQKLHVRPGQAISLAHRKFTVSGVFHSGTGYVDTGVIATLADAQALANRTPQEVTTFAVKIAPQSSSLIGSSAPPILAA